MSRSSRVGSADLVGVDFARVRVAARRRRTWLPAALVGALLAALGLAQLRLQILRMRYALGEATLEELAEMMALARQLEAAFREAYRPEGINLGMNLGRPAGAGVADHIHMHLVPRWTGDTNFMTVVSGTRVIPEEPEQACLRLRPYFAR